MKRCLSIAVSLVMILILSGSIFVANAETDNKIFYLNINRETVESVEIYYHIDSGDNEVGFEKKTMDELEQDGLYRVSIPSNAIDIYFLVYLENTFEISDSYTISNLFGNVYNFDDKTWSDYESDHSSNTTTTINVAGKYAESSDIVSVDISWGAMEFTYNKGNWDPQKHEYTNGTEKNAWTANGNTITVTNHSNVGVTASFGFAKADGTNISGTFQNVQNQTVSSIDLATADNGVNGQAGTPVTGSANFYITSGSIEKDMSSLGTITVTITKQSK